MHHFICELAIGATVLYVHVHKMEATFRLLHTLKLIRNNGKTEHIGRMDKYDEI